MMPLHKGLTFQRICDTLSEMRKLLAILAVLVLLPLFVVEARAPQITPNPPKLGKSWYGMASWYGDHWAGRKTACGQKFDPELLTAAHPYLKCGTMLRVTNVRTGKMQYAKVTDRGPYEEGREIDLSAKVAKSIGITRFGVEQVKIEVIE